MDFEAETIFESFGKTLVASHTHYKLLGLATLPLRDNELFRNVGDILAELENDSHKLLL